MTDILHHAGTEPEERKKIETEQEAWRTIEAYFANERKEFQKTLGRLHAAQYELSEKEKELSEKDKELSEKDKELSEKAKKLNEKDKELSEKDRLIEELKRKLNEQ